MPKPRKRKLPKKAGATKRRGTRTKRVPIRTHYRSPRGDNAGKKRVRVRGHKRNTPRNR